MDQGDMTRHFRTVCGRFATGVTVILTETPEGVHGMTANAFMSVSLDPILIAIAVYRRGRMAALLGSPGTEFSLSVLAQDQQAVAEFYSRPGALRAADIVAPGPGQGPPMVPGAGAWMLCRTQSVIPAGDHFLVLAAVESCDLDVEKTPLVFYAGHYWEHLDRERDNPIEWQLLEL